MEQAVENSEQRFRIFYLEIGGAILTVLILTALIEWWLGCLPLGPDGQFGWWEGNIWSRFLSQRFADPYSFTHIVHGLVFCLLLRWLKPTMTVSRMFYIALLLEAGWELLENSPPMIERYRSVTMALGYSGDSILNSLSDILMMSLGFLLVHRCQLRNGWILAVSIELALLFCIRDNLTLNLIMLIYPLDFIKTWQMAGSSLP